MFKTLGTILLLTSSLSSPCVKTGDVKRAYSSNYVQSFVNQEYSINATLNYFSNYQFTDNEPLVFCFQGDFIDDIGDSYTYMECNYYNYGILNNNFRIKFGNSESDIHQFYGSAYEYQLSDLLFQYRGNITSVDYQYWLLNISSFNLHADNYKYFQFNTLLSLINDGFTSFQFDNQINYYAPYSGNIDTMFVLDANMTTAGHNEVKTIITGQLFMSGGEIFDTIRLRYINAIAQSYMDNGNRIVWRENGYASYTWLEYFNSETNILRVVNTRNTLSWQKDSTSGINQQRGSTWVSQNYRTVSFFVSPSDTDLTTLGTLNNARDVSSYFISNGTSVDLNNAFDLINIGLGGISSLFGIMVLPNITLGLLILLPLTIALLLFVIKLFKR